MTFLVCAKEEVMPLKAWRHKIQGVLSGRLSFLLSVVRVGYFIEEE